MKYKKGDEVKIIKELYGHRFPIGSKVVIDLVREEDNDYRAESNYDFWWIRDDEVEPWNESWWIRTIKFWNEQVDYLPSLFKRRK